MTQHTTTSRFKTLLPKLHARWGAALACSLAMASPGTQATVLDLLRSAPEGSWLQANQNTFSSVWTPPALRNDFRTDGNFIRSIISAWSSFAWDSSSSNLIIYGGGHANYGGNDVYMWNGNSLLWERASLPSLVSIGTAGSYTYGYPADGSLNAPAAAHTYDNSVYLKASDRYLTFGGAAWNNGNAYFRQNPDGSVTRTGPYLFNQNLADANKVGGTTGSGVNPTTLGSQAWSNRDTYTTSNSIEKPLNFVDGFSDTTVVGGKDVVYVGGSIGGTAVHLYRYTINDLANPSLDTWERVGTDALGVAVGNAAGALSADKNLFVRTGDAAKPFLVWNLANPGVSNNNLALAPVDLTGGLAPTNWTGYGLIYDPERGYFVAWKGEDDVWKLEAPDGAFSLSGWTVSRLDVTTATTPGAVDTQGGVLGKWQYASDIDAYVGLQDPLGGDVWVYKPFGWTDPATLVPEPATWLLLGLGAFAVLRRARQVGPVVP